MQLSQLEKVCDTESRGHSDITPSGPIPANNHDTIEALYRYKADFLDATYRRQTLCVVEDCDLSTTPYMTNINPRWYRNP